MKSILRIASLMLMTLALSACGKSDELAWTEDVKLPDGRVVTLTRWVEFKGPYAMGDTPNESKQRLEFKHPDTGEIVKWENSKETGMLNTVALVVDKGHLNILSVPSLGDDSHKFNCPNPPYLLYEYVNGKWQSKPLADIPDKLIRANLTTHIKEKREEIETKDRHLTAAQTSDSYTYSDVKRVPYVINFDGMPVQTFENKNCTLGPNINLLLFLGK
jgi:hypothetical protein